MKRCPLFVGALVATFITGCASLDNKKSPELYESSTETGTHIDRPGLPPKMADPIAVERVFRNSSSAIAPIRGSEATGSARPQSGSSESTVPVSTRCRCHMSGRCRLLSGVNYFCR